MQSAMNDEARFDRLCELNVVAQARIALPGRASFCYNSHMHTDRSELCEVFDEAGRPLGLSSRHPAHFSLLKPHPQRRRIGTGVFTPNLKAELGKMKKRGAWNRIGVGQAAR